MWKQAKLARLAGKTEDYQQGYSEGNIACQGNAQKRRLPCCAAQFQVGYDSEYKNGYASGQAAGRTGDGNIGHKRIGKRTVEYKKGYHAGHAMRRACKQELTMSCCKVAYYDGVNVGKRKGFKDGYKSERSK